MYLHRKSFKPQGTVRNFILIGMKRILILAAAFLCGLTSFAQTDAQKAAAEAAKALAEAPQAEQKAPKPKYWTKSLKTQINFGQTSLTNWAAGGDNTVSLASYIDGNANFKKKQIFWNNRLQLDYGFIYSSSKPILQKNTDRIYLESSWGYQAIKTLYMSANYNFRSQFSNTWNYPTPNQKANGDPFEDGYKPVRPDWLAAKTLASGFLAPAYTNLALGMDWKPAKWISANFAPLTGGFVIVGDASLRKNYGMQLRKKYQDLGALTEAEKTQYDEIMASGDADRIGELYRGSKFEFGAQLKVNLAFNVNNNFAYSSQIVLFSNYLDKPQNMRVNWDNRFDWKLAKYFSLTLVTNLIYDEHIMIFSEKDNMSRARVQFKESVAFGFTWLIAK